MYNTCAYLEVDRSFMASPYGKVRWIIADPETARRVDTAASGLYSRSVEEEELARLDGLDELRPQIPVFNFNNLSSLNEKEPMQNLEVNSVDNRLGVLQRQLKHQRVAILALVVVWLSSMAWLMLHTPRFPAVMSVERLEVREPDGKPALVLANSQRPIAATIDGRQVMAAQEDERKGTPSIIFFDGKGDEVGGMLFGVRETSNGYSVTRHLSLDGYKQDQTVVLSHYQDPRGSTSGLTISNRPNHSQLDAFRQLGVEPGASREQLTKAIQAIPQEQRASRLRELFGTTRAFFGSARTGEARLELRDGQGRVRIVLDAPDAGEPSIRILDDKGQVALRLPK